MTTLEEGSRALVVDDSRATRRILGRMLVEIGFEVTEAENGKEALATLNADEQPFDLALVDWNMPEVDGIELVKAIRADAALDGLKVLMVTTEADIDHMMTALDAGADEYAMKPFTAAVIREKLALLGIGESV